MVPIEAEKDIPFAIKRVYFITDVLSDTVRGLHAHKTLQQVLICLKGSVTIAVENAVTNEKQIFELNSIDKGLYIGKMSWRSMYNFQPDTVLLVLADDHYDESDYIRDRAEYQIEVDKEVMNSGDHAK